MGYRSLAGCLEDLKATNQVVVIETEIDPRLEAAAIVRRVYEASGPAVFFRRLKGTEFPALGNLFGTMDRTRYLFRDSLQRVRRLVEMKVNPAEALKHPWRYASLPLAGLTLLPRRVRNGPILAKQTTLDRLPQIQSWPDDGGAFVTLPQVYSEDPGRPGLAKSNLGMYRVQISGNDYEPNREVGLHYQIHRGIGVHHARAIERGEPLRVNIAIGGPPSLTVAAVMPLPEGLPELSFAGVLGGHRIPVVSASHGLAMPAEADFVISGTIDASTLKPEGPFGDHLGYYSLKHDFPVLKVDKVYQRPNPIWLFTSVGRPPQEDTSFGDLIHELTGPIIPTVIPGIHAVNAVDEAGVHPLLLAVGSERYVPYAKVRRPQELLTSANAILGQGQMSLAKYLWIVAKEDDPSLDIQNLAEFFTHALQRVDWREDIHFQTRTTIDTLDYSGHGFNQGSKAVIAAAGPKRRELAFEVSSGLRLGDRLQSPRMVMPGVLAVQGPSYQAGSGDLRAFCLGLQDSENLDGIALIVLVDDSEFTSRSLRNFVWVTFTRSNPAPDIDGVKAFTHDKHWGCAGPLVIDARIKPQHAPPLIDDPAVERRIDALATVGGPLHGIL